MDFKEMILNFEYSREAAAGLVIVVLMVMSYFRGRSIGKRRMNALVKKREGNFSQNDLIMKPAPDGAMELQLTRKAYKNLRNGPLETMIMGQKDGMVFRIMLA